MIPEMETKAIFDPIFDDWINKNNLDIDFLDELQTIHDTIEVNDWKNALILLAREYNLSIDVIKNF